MSFLSGDHFRKKQVHQSQWHGRTPFTPTFYRFLLGFSLILALSFATLAFLGSTFDNQLTVSAVPGCDTPDTDKTGTNQNQSPEKVHC